MTPAPGPAVVTPNPVAALLRSRKFLLMLVDVVVSCIAHFAAEYAPPSVQQDILFLTITLQPVVIAVIAGIAYEDAHA